MEQQTEQTRTICQPISTHVKQFVEAANKYFKHNVHELLMSSIVIYSLKPPFKTLSETDWHDR